MKRVIKVFIADASEDFRSMLAEVIDAEPDMCVAGTASDGSVARELVLRLKPDVLITDLILRELDGLELLKALRERGFPMRIIVVSGFVNDRAAANVSRLGADYYFPKPCRITQLLSRIRELAEKRPDIPRVTREFDPAISEALMSFGILPHLQGYRYLRDSIRRTIMDESTLRGVTKILYPELAKLYHTTPVSVERAIRNAIHTAWENGDEGRRELYFGSAFKLDARPTNSAFIAMLAEFVEKKLCLAEMEL